MDDTRIDTQPRGSEFRQEAAVAVELSGGKPRMGLKKAEWSEPVVQKLIYLSQRSNACAKDGSGFRRAVFVV
jgi:hypothetical protein